MSNMNCLSQKSESAQHYVDKPISQTSQQAVNRARSGSRERYTSTSSSSSGQYLDWVPNMVNLADYRATPLDYQLVTSIGGGCEDAVCICVAKHIPTDSLVAIRRVRCDEAEDLHVYMHEIVSTRTFNHASILPILATFVHNREIWAVMPYMAYGSCSDLLMAHFKDGMSEIAIVFILRDILLALDYIHQAGCIHRSIRASHILISATGHVCLSGFRFLYHTVRGGKLSHVVHDFPQNAKKGLNWLSPEILEQNLSGYDCKSDIYSLGITACELANGQEPFSNMPLTQMLYEKLNGTTPKLLDSTTLPEYQMVEEDLNAGVQATADSGIGDTAVSGQTIPIPYQRTFSENFHHFVQLCLSPDPNVRPTASQLLHHSLFKQVRKKVTENILPDLLQPVTPLTDLNKLPKDDSAVDSLVDQMVETDISIEQWVFDT